jgi:hypothetical protein
MKLGVTKIFCAVFIAFLIVALGSTAQTQKPQGCNDPPWFGPGPENKCNNKQKTYIHTGAVAWPKSTRNETDCFLYIHICSFHLNRKTIVPLGTHCPVAKDFAAPTICCDEFDKAVKTKQPCDPMQDADCDGLPNDTDPDPLGPRDPDTDHKCAQLGADVNNAYRKAGANSDTALGAGQAAREDCYKRRHDKKCGIPPPEVPDEPEPKFPEPEKCKQLFWDVYNAYLTAGANIYTATAAGQAAKYDCWRRASKM